MKQFIFSFALIFCITNISKAQDSLIMKSGEVIQAKVIEINTAEVKYKKFDNLTGPLYSILKSELSSSFSHKASIATCNDFKHGIINEHVT